MKDNLAEVHIILKDTPMWEAPFDIEWSNRLQKYIAHAEIPKEFQQAFFEYIKPFVFTYAKQRKIRSNK